MVSTEVSLGRRAESSTSGPPTFSMPGADTVRRPKPGSVRAVSVKVQAGRLHVKVADGREVRVPLDWFPRLIEASDRERRNYQLLGGGVLIHWPDVDEDIDVPNLFRP